MQIRPVLFLLAYIFGSLLHAQEICNNAIDDDFDGLIDLNDTTDCVCTGVLSGGGQVESLLPNPSFEDFDCIPTTYSQLDCASVWSQATGATSDYFMNVAGGLWPTGVILSPSPMETRARGSSSPPVMRSI